MKFVLHSTLTKPTVILFYPFQYCGSYEYDVFINRRGMMFKSNSLDEITNLSEFENKTELKLLFVGEELSNMKLFNILFTLDQIQKFDYLKTMLGCNSIEFVQN